MGERASDRQELGREGSFAEEPLARVQARLRPKTGWLGEARGQQREGRLERMSMKRRGDGATGELSDTSEQGPRTVLPGNISVISRDHLLSAVSP